MMRTSTFIVATTEPLERALLQHPQQLGLDVERQSPISSRNSVPRSPARSGRPLRHRPVKAPRSWPNNSLSTSARRQRRAVDADSGCAARGLSHGWRARQLLAGARFTEQQHGAVGVLDPLRAHDRAHQRIAAADDLVEAAQRRRSRRAVAIAMRRSQSGGELLQPLSRARRPGVDLRALERERADASVGRRRREQRRRRLRQSRRGLGDVAARRASLFGGDQIEDLAEAPAVVVGGPRAARDARPLIRALDRVALGGEDQQHRHRRAGGVGEMVQRLFDRRGRGLAVRRRSRRKDDR
jgi:hypothetical protein